MSELRAGLDLPSVLLPGHPGGSNVPTAPILGPHGQPLPGSIAELTTVRLGGHDQALLLRGHSTSNPVLLYLVGGPGGSQVGHVRAAMEGLEEDFVLAVWEQRGAGKSYPALDPTGTHTLDQAVADTIAGS